VQALIPPMPQPAERNKLLRKNKPTENWQACNRNQLFSMQEKREERVLLRLSASFFSTKMLKFASQLFPLNQRI
jgi:hypothetical protein